MRVEFFPPVSLTEPRYWVRHEEGLAMMLGPGSIELGSKRSSMERIDYAAGDLGMCPHHEEKWVGLMNTPHRYVGISLTEFGNCVEPHAAFRTGQVFSFSEGHEGVLNGGECRTTPFQLHGDEVNALYDIHFQRFQKQRPLVAKSVIHALPPDGHDAHQVVGEVAAKPC